MEGQEKSPEMSKAFAGGMARSPIFNGRICATANAAFILGRHDRIERRPVTCYVAIVDGVAHKPEEYEFWDSEPGQELDRAYLAGYDPHNDLGLTKPEYVEQEREFARKLFAENGLLFPKPNECLSRCDESERAAGHQPASRAIAVAPGR